MVKKMLRTKVQDRKLENLPKMETNQDNYIFHPNLLYIIFDHVVVVFHQFSSRI